MRKHPGKALTNMVLSCVLCSIAVNWVALPNGFVVTGITGLSMAAAQFTGVNYALIYYGLALAILLCTALALGWWEVSNILVLSLLYPVVLWGLNHIQVEIILQEKLIAVMLFGAIYGLGSGLTYRLGYSYGGTDTLAKLLKQRLFRTVPLKYLLLALAVVLTLAVQSAFAAALNLGFVLFSAQLPLVTGNLHSMVDCALIGLALSAFRSESILRDAVVPVPRPPQTQTA